MRQPERRQAELSTPASIPARFAWLPHDPNDPRREVDLFATEPVPFAELWDASQVVDVAGVDVRVASIDHLIAMKRQAGRPQDLADIVALEELRDDTGRDG